MQFTYNLLNEITKYVMNKYISKIMKITNEMLQIRKHNPLVGFQMILK